MKEAAVYVNPQELTPWDKNPRNNDAAVLNVMSSIREYGFSSPIIARKETGQIIAGHTRWKAAQELGLELVPVRYLDISEKKAAALAVADNKIGEIATWDDAKLAEVLKDIQAESDGFDFSSIGFEESEINALLTNWDDVLDGEVTIGDDNTLEDEQDDGMARIVVEIPIVSSHDASTAIRIGLLDGGFQEKDFKLRVT